MCNGWEHNNLNSDVSLCTNCVFCFLADRFPEIITLSLQVNGFDHPCQAIFQYSFAGVRIRHLHQILTRSEVKSRDLSS